MPVSGSCPNSVSEYSNRHFRERGREKSNLLVDFCDFCDYKKKKKDFRNFHMWIRLGQIDFHAGASHRVADRTASDNGIASATNA